MNIFKYILLYCLLCTTSLTQASHLVGGTIQVKWLGGTSYQVSVKIFRDCDPNSRTPEQPTLPGFDDPIYVGLFEKGTDKLMQTIRLDLDLNAYRKLDYSGIYCPIITTGCTDLTTYTKVVTMPESEFTNNAGYYLSWERCCRNKIINNIQVPGEAAIALYAEIPAARFHNSSPEYQNNPVTLMCTNTLFKYNLNFVDPDRHQLKYSLVTPLNGHLDKNNTSNPNSNGNLMPLNPQPYKKIAWNTGYGAASAIKGTLPLTIDSLTGEITCIPSNPGVYIAAILVEEFLNGVKIGEVSLEIQFTVINCGGSPPKTTMISVDNQIIFPNDTIFIEIPDKVCLTIRSEKGDGANGDSIYMNITSPIMDSPVAIKPVFPAVVSGVGMVSAPFCIQSACEYMNIPLFQVFVETTDNSCPLNKKSKVLFWVKVTKPISQLPNYVPQKGLVAWYPFDCNTNDLSGNNLHSTSFGTTLTKDRYNLSSKACEFNGSSGYLKIQHSDTIVFQNGITFSAWVNPKDYKNSSIVDKMSISGNGFRISTRDNSDNAITPTKYWAQGGNYFDANVKANSLSNILLNEWQFIVGSLGSDDTIRLYINGNLESTSYHQGHNLDQLTPIFIGKGSTTNEYELFSGTIDDVGIWNRALTQVEVSQLFNSNVTGLVKIFEKPELHVYPNPSNNKINLISSYDLNDTPFELTDILGNILLTGKLFDDTKSINIEKLSNGIYFLNFKEISKKSYKIVKNSF